ncbi:MAG: GntR family transcriptional regulator [Anaerolineaceae bacterium]|nr:GntR family transcriptional regulator [Anaerolineaceae bacterium]
MGPIDKNSVIPLYYQLAEYLRERIRSGELHTGDQIPSERELMERFTLSRNTVRQALDILANEGLIVRNHGRGTYVSNLSPTFNYTLGTFFENRQVLRQAGYTPSVRQLSAEKIIPPEMVRSAMQLQKDEPAICFTLVFYADGRPAMYTQDFLPIKIAGDYDLPGSQEGYLEYLDRSSGQRVEYVLVDIAPVEANVEIAHIFECPIGSPVLLFKEVFLDQTQTVPIAYSLNYFNREMINFRLLARRG